MNNWERVWSVILLLLFCKCHAYRVQHLYDIIITDNSGGCFCPEHFISKIVEWRVSCFTEQSQSANTLCEKVCASLEKNSRYTEKFPFLNLLASQTCYHRSCLSNSTELRERKFSLRAWIHAVHQSGPVCFIFVEKNQNNDVGLVKQSCDRSLK